MAMCEKSFPRCGQEEIINSDNLQNPRTRGATSPVLHCTVQGTGLPLRLQALEPGTRFESGHARRDSAWHPLSLAHWQGTRQLVAYSA
eukprot:1195569-Prorocentrum_minimum.AAC.3